MQIKDIFTDNQFRIIKIKYEYNSPIKDIIVRINSKEYEVKYSTLERFLSSMGISLNEELSKYYIPIERLDNRPFYKKVIDSQLGKRVDFNNTKHYVTIDFNFLEKTLGVLYEKKFKN